MENASKALIIAGSVLVAIMIVALGVRIFNSARGSADTTSLDSAEITMFNQKFERFAGKSVSGSNVKSMLSFAISNASTNKDDSIKLPKVIWYWNKTDPDKEDHTPSVASKGLQDYIDKLADFRQKIKSTATFDVELGYGTSGLVNQIKITTK